MVGTIVPNGLWAYAKMIRDSRLSRTREPRVPISADYLWTDVVVYNPNPWLGESTR